MAICNTCGTTILFGGKKVTGLRYCNDDCLAQLALAIAVDSVPQDALIRAAQELHQGLCSHCGGSGPIDIHTSHQIWSMLLMTSWKSTPRISCRSCGIKQQLGDFFFSLLCGWWGVPWGFIMTPVQLVRNLVGILRAPDPMQPSEQLLGHVRRMLAEPARFAEEADEKPDEKPHSLQSTG